MISRVIPDTTLPSEVLDFFDKWAELNGIGDHEEDWRPWWDCFEVGYRACLQISKKDQILSPYMVIKREIKSDEP